ncbi:MAG TPA: AarF/UbiB family protein [Kofleriaceae bacterium]|nr:AarF/UbiB family protein [Kofleriaceae bacterium]
MPVDDTGTGKDPREIAARILRGWSQSVMGSIDRLVQDLKADTGALRREGEELGRALAGRLTPIAQAARATPRAARIAGEAAVVFGAYRWHALLARQLSPEAAAVEREAVDRRSAERVATLCVELRGAMLKIGQFASTRRDLLPPAWVEALSRLQDSVPPVPFDAIRARVEAELGAPLAERFASFDETPIAAASLAQVHGAVLPDGTRVAVKVQVPGIEELVDGDLHLLSMLAGAFADLVGGIDLGAIAREVSRSVREELDYTLEAERTRRMRDDLASDPAVHVPRVIDELSTGRVLCLERIDGIRLTEHLDARGGDPAVLAALVRTYAAQILALGRFQADPHPGNFLVEPDGRLALLDFGALATLGDDERRAYAALIAAMAARDRESAAFILAGLGFEVRAGDPGALLEMADLILDAFRPAPDRPLAEMDPREAFDRALAVARTSSITIPHHFVLLGRALSSLAGLLLAYRADIDLFSLVAPHLTDFAHKAGSPGSGG